MDYLEEQKSEIEALQSIYPEELEVMEESPSVVFNVTLVSTSEKYDVRNAEVRIQFTFPAKYPDEGPVIDIKEYDELEERHAAELEQLMHSQVEENLGMPMIFTLLSCVQERLADMVEEILQEKEDEKERRLREEEEANKKKFEGTRCTIETFMAWKAGFEKEMSALKDKDRREEKDKLKPTGRELFLGDSSLYTSDIQLLDEGDEDAVAVDESLFEDLDDLDLEDDT